MGRSLSSQESRKNVLSQEKSGARFGQPWLASLPHGSDQEGEKKDNQ